MMMLSIVDQLAARVDVAAPSDNKVSGLNSEECSPEKIWKMNNYYTQWQLCSYKKFSFKLQFSLNNMDKNLLNLVPPYY